MKNTNPNRRGILRPKQVRDANSAVVLQLLPRFDRISRADLARRSGLSEGTVSHIMSGLREQQLVSEAGAENSTGGRPATRLQLSDIPRAFASKFKTGKPASPSPAPAVRSIESVACRTPATPELDRAG